jgi:3-oxoacid CoA-transferase subunit A
MATAAKLVIAEVEEIVAVGELEPDEIVTPHIFVDYIVKAQKGEI